MNRTLLEKWSWNLWLTLTWQENVSDPRVTYLILDVIWFFTCNYGFYLPKFDSIQFNPNSKPKATCPWTLVVRKGGRWQRREADLDCRYGDPPFQRTSLLTWFIHRPGTARFCCLAIFLLFYFKLWGLLSASLSHLTPLRWGILP